MPSILPGVRFSVREKLLLSLRVADARDRPAPLSDDPQSPQRPLLLVQTAEVLGVHDNTTVYRVARRFRRHGEWGLWDARRG